MQRVYVADPALPHMVDGRVYVLDAADMSLKGMMESGFAGMLLAAHEKHLVYIATTFYERLTRGKRTDVIQGVQQPDPEGPSTRFPCRPIAPRRCPIAACSSARATAICS
ncbi:amine dehydrogenase large subunit [Rhodopseudomonas sp. B29]|uniref:amine dehydrogenase large subunit n=1 Tax=Rhodopseudomonas sp. B29 TaxID=95607 RepID=UPI0035E3CF0F